MGEKYVFVQLRAIGNRVSMLWKQYSIDAAGRQILLFLTMLFLFALPVIYYGFQEKLQHGLHLNIWRSYSLLLPVILFLAGHRYKMRISRGAFAFAACINRLNMDGAVKIKKKSGGRLIAAELSDKIQLFTPGQIKRIDEQVTRYVIKERRFLQPRYSLKALSEDTRIPIYQLSLFMNKYYRTSYNDFVNRLRVDYCCRKIAAGECALKTLEALAAESGFNNRTSFTHSFKKFTGFTPSEFLKNTQISGRFDVRNLPDRYGFTLQPEAVDVLK